MYMLVLAALASLIPYLTEFSNTVVWSPNCVTENFLLMDFFNQLEGFSTKLFFLSWLNEIINIYWMCQLLKCAYLLYLIQVLSL